ncbi:hypothetical protein IT408_01765 [Candidatus Uhrbacteria bacterium]|nr:hypothetical protein [Candidatus Uhrbacteria bacterium]
MLSRLPRFFVFGLVLLSVFGFGCSSKKPEVKTASQPKQPIKSSNNPSVLLFPAETNPDAAITKEYQEILANFQKMNSFTTSFDMSTSQGQSKGVFQFIRPNRLSGNMQTDGGTFNIIIVDNALFLKTENGKWEDFSNQPQTKNLIDMLQKVLSGNTAFDANNLNPDALVLKSHDDLRSCDLYKTTVKTPQGKLASIELCAENKLPKHVSMVTDLGPVRIDYSDYNKLFLIEKPH